MKEVIPYFLLSLFKWSLNLSHSKTSCRLCAQTIKHCHANGHTHKHVKTIGDIPGRVHWSIEEVKSTDTSNKLQFVWLEAITLAKLEDGIRNGIKRHLRHKLLKETKTGKIQHQVWELWKCADGNLHLRPGEKESTHSLTALLKRKSSSRQPHTILEVWLLKIRLHISIVYCVLCSEEFY